MKILALDLATRTGFATWDGQRRESGFIDFDLKRGESPGMRFIRFNAWLKGTIAVLHPDVVFYEKPWGAMKSGSAAEVALGLSTRVMEACDACMTAIPYQPVNGSTLKKWVTGKGNAKKPAMVAAVNERFGPPFITDDNEADAIALLEYARAELVAAEVNP